MFVHCTFANSEQLRTNDLNNPEIKRALLLLTQGISSLASSIYNYFNNSSTYKKIVVRSNNNLGEQEQTFLSARDKINHKAMQQFVGFEFERSAMPRIAFCFSGGGFRAKMATLGFLKGAQDIGLMQAASYMTGLSGSTWAIASWIASGKTLDEYVNTLGAYTYQGLEPIIHPTHVNKISDKVMNHIMHNQRLSAINLYGDLLANILLADFGDARFDISLKETHKACTSAHIPLPIYTAATVNIDPYEWFEFTPFEMGSAYTKTFIDIDGYGRIFKRGEDQGYAPILPLGYMLGIYGSAFNVNVGDLIRITGSKLSEKIASLPDKIESFVNNLLVDVVHSPINSLRLLPSKVRNISYKLESHPLSHKKWLTLVDAGIAFNLPFPPLMRKERAIDIIIVYDASADNNNFDSLKGAQDYAITHNLRFPDIQYKDLDKLLVRVFKDDNDPTCPIVIYFPMIKNNDYSTNFDPIESSKHGYCNTFNFTYSQENINELAGLTEFTIKQHEQIIKDTIVYAIEKKKKILS